MHLLKDWKNVAKRAWSFRLGILAAILSGCEVILPLFVDVLPRGIFAGLSFAAVSGATIARVVAQNNLTDSPKGD